MAAVDPKARIQTITYAGGRVTATLGLLDKLYGVQATSWTKESAGTFIRKGGRMQRVIGGPESVRKQATVTRKAWVGRMASPNATGNIATVYFKDGTNWQVRYGGSFTSLKNSIAGGTAKDDVLQIMSERGATANKGIPIAKTA